MSICQRERWLAMIARSDDEVVIAPLGEAALADAQVELICDAVLHAFSDGPPASIAGVNVPSAALQQALTENIGRTNTSSRRHWPGLAFHPIRWPCCRPPPGWTNRPWRWSP